MNSQGVNQSQCKAGHLHVNRLWLYTRPLYVTHSTAPQAPGLYYILLPQVHISLEYQYALEHGNPATGMDK